MRIQLLTLLVLVWALPVLAVDGVLEINQTCAVPTGCFAGDATGFPVQINASGSNRPTSNLGTTKTGILVTADETTDSLRRKV